jgi:hypothetical protein
MDATALGGKKALQQNNQCLELGSHNLYRSEVTAEPKVNQKRYYSQGAIIMKKYKKIPYVEAVMTPSPILLTRTPELRKSSV